MDEVDDDYRLTIYKVRGQQQSDRIAAHSYFRATATRGQAEELIEDVLML